MLCPTQYTYSPTPTLSKKIFLGKKLGYSFSFIGKEKLYSISLLQKCPLFLERVVNEVYFAVANMAIPKIINKN